MSPIVIDKFINNDNQGITMAFFDASKSRAPVKRHLWLISLTFPTTPLIGVALALSTGNPHLMWVPVLIFYVLTPLLDYLIGEDKTDLLGQIEAETEISSFYKIMVHLLLPVLYLTWIIGAAFVTHTALPIDVYLATVLAFGWGLAFAINSGHEVGHKTDKLSKWIALLMLAPSFYGHFRVEHNTGHHSDVATPRDSATARFGESYWAFAAREYTGAWKRAWRLECKRASRKGYTRFSLKNEVVLSVTLQLVIWGTMVALFGPVALPYMVATAIISSMALSSQNYIAHYGLLRDKRADGKYLPCQPQHSWNCNQLVTNLTSYNLARHSDHHAHPSRHYQHLRTFPDAPHLPYGYMTMFLIAYVPPLFRKIMDPRVLDNVGGDMSRVLTKDMV